MLKKVLVLMLAGVGALAVSGASFGVVAQTAGFYVDGNVGWGKVAPRDIGVTVRGTNAAGNVALGYKINAYLGLEIGGGLYSDVNSDSGKINTNNNFLDAAVKVIVPFGNSFDMFGKLGVAKVHTKWGATGDDRSGTTYNRPAAIGAIGVGYWFTPNFGVDLQGLGAMPNTNKTPSMYAVSVGLTFVFPKTAMV